MHSQQDMFNVTRIMATWVRQDNEGVDFEKHDKDIMHTVVFSAIHSKLDMADMKIIVPDAVILLLLTLTDGNPGQSILLFKEILEGVVKRSGRKIRPGYVIQPMDVGTVWSSKWPFMQDKDINEKYHKKWLEQKKPRGPYPETDNKCDMAQW